MDKHQQFWLAIAVTFILALLTVVQVADPKALGLPPIVTAWIGVVTGFLGIVQGFLPKVSRMPDHQEDG